MNIAIQGETGSFHHQVARGWFGDGITIIAAESFSRVFNSLDNHQADYAIVAIENSLYGSINEVYDLIEAHDYPIIGEVYLRIKQQLIGLPGASLSDITTVYSHPVALAQCEQSLGALLPNANRPEYPDTAAAVRFIKEQQNPHYGAVASELAAQLYDLPVISHDIEDHHANYTRFVVLSPRPFHVIDANKTSIVFETNHTPGSLAQVLSVFAAAGINLSKLTSRPVIGKVWHYRFYADLEIAGKPVHDLLAQVQPYCTNVTVLGEYVRDQLVSE